jgi:hypothetical protein
MARGNAFFVQRLNDHIQYLRRVTNTLKGEDDFRGCTCNQCKLGLWLYSEGREALEACTEDGEYLFTVLEEKHKRFHDVSHEALVRHAAGDYVNGYRSMTDMLRISRELVSLLLEADQQASAAPLTAYI